MEDNPATQDATVMPANRPKGIRARAAHALANERRALRRSAFSMGAAVRSSATLSGIQSDSSVFGRRVNETVQSLARDSRGITEAMDKASNDLSAWMRRASNRVRGWASGSGTIKGLGIDAQRMRRRLEQRRENREHRMH